MNNSSFSSETKVFHNNINNSNDDEDEENFICIEHIVTLGMLPAVLNVTIELDLLGIISKAGPGGQLTAAEIVSRLPTENPSAAAMVDRMLRLLATYKVVTCSVDYVSDKNGASKRRYGLAPAAKYLLPDKNGVSLVPIFQLGHHKAFFDSQNKLKDAVIKGGSTPFKMAHGVSVFEYAASDPSLNNMFNKAMHSYSTIIIKKILDTYKGFEDIKVLVEVAGGVGHTICAIVSKYPYIKGVEHISGDMFESVPQGDAILLKWIIHNWNDEFCAKLLRNCYEALPEKGKVIIIEKMLSELPETTEAEQVASQIDLIMMSRIEDGRERTKEEFINLANSTGFFDIKFNSCVFTFWIIELYK